MARYSKIERRIWNDQNFDELPDDAKFIFFLLLTHPQLTALGAIPVSIADLAAKLRWPVERTNCAMQALKNKTMVKYDQRKSLIWLPNFLKYNLPENPNVVKSWESSIGYLPECTLRDELILEARQLVELLSESFQQALPECFRKAMPNLSQTIELQVQPICETLAEGFLEEQITIDESLSPTLSKDFQKCSQTLCEE